MLIFVIKSGAKMLLKRHAAEVKAFGNADFDGAHVNHAAFAVNVGNTVLGRIEADGRRCDIAQHRAAVGVQKAYIAKVRVPRKNKLHADIGKHMPDVSRTHVLVVRAYSVSGDGRHERVVRAGEYKHALFARLLDYAVNPAEARRRICSARVALLVVSEIVVEHHAPCLAVKRDAVGMRVLAYGNRIGGTEFVVEFPQLLIGIYLLKLGSYRPFGERCKFTVDDFGVVLRVLVKERLVPRSFFVPYFAAVLLNVCSVVAVVVRRGGDVHLFAAFLYFAQNFNKVVVARLISPVRKVTRNEYHVGVLRRSLPECLLAHGRLHKKLLIVGHVFHHSTRNIMHVGQNGYFHTEYLPFLCILHFYIIFCGLHFVKTHGV